MGECILPNCANVNELKIAFTQNEGIYTSDASLLQKSWPQEEKIGVSSAILLHTIKRAMKRVAPHLSSTGIFITAIDSPEKSANIEEEVKICSEFIPMHILHNLKAAGPCKLIKSACASGVSAFHEAYNSLLLNECEVAIVAGLYLKKFRGKSGELISNGNIVEGESCDGIHRPLDYDGNGGVVNDACGVIILKRVFDALADGDKFLAHVSASSTVNVGHRSQFTEISASSMKIACTNALTRHLLNPCASFPEYFELSGTGLPF